MTLLGDSSLLEYEWDNREEINSSELQSAIFEVRFDEVYSWVKISDFLKCIFFALILTFLCTVSFVSFIPFPTFCFRPLLWVYFSFVSLLVVIGTLYLIFVLLNIPLFMYAFLSIDFNHHTSFFVARVGALRPS